MIVRAMRACALAAVLLVGAAAAPAAAQDKEITDEFIDLMIRAFGAEQAEMKKVETQLAEVDDRIKKFLECKELFDAAADASGSRLGGIAARAAIRAKCGASDVDGFMKDRQKILEGPEKAALALLKLKSADYGKLKERVQGYFASGSGFSAAEAALLAKRKNDIAGAMGVDLATYASTGSGEDRGARSTRTGGRGMRHVGWTSDYAWQYIGELFQVMYLSGAMVFEKPYETGQWTKWEIVQRDAEYEGDDPKQLETKREMERALIGKTTDGGEWWRTTIIDFYDEGDGKVVADTVIMESLFRGENEYVKQLVRVRAKLPGQEPNELMVPQHMAMLSFLSVFPMKPTAESVQGATVGNERIGQFDARQVRFGAGGGTIEWWLADNAPGGWVQFRASEQKEPDAKAAGYYVLRMTGSGTGARSALGVL